MVHLWKRLKVKKIKKEFQSQKPYALLEHWHLSSLIIARNYESEIICF